MSAIGGERAARMARMSASTFSAGHLSPNMVHSKSSQSIPDVNIANIRPSAPGYLFESIDGRRSVDESSLGSRRGSTPQRQQSIYTNGSSTNQTYPSSSRSSSPSSTSSSSSLSQLNVSTSNHHNNNSNSSDLAINTLATNTLQPQQIPSASSSSTLDDAGSVTDNLSQNKTLAVPSPSFASSPQNQRPYGQPNNEFHSLFPTATNGIDIGQSYGW